MTLSASRLSILAISAASLFLTGCVTRPKVYAAPDTAKVVATSKRLSAAIDRQNETTVRAEKKVQAAQETSDRVAVQSGTVLNLIRELKLLVPEELKPKVEALEAAQNEELQDTGTLSSQVADVRGEITQLKADNAAVVKERDQLVNVDQPKLFAAGQQIARDATTERNARIAAEKQLVQQKIFRILWTVGGSVAVLLIIAVVLLAIFGKLGIVLAKVGIKAGV